MPQPSFGAAGVWRRAATDSVLWWVLAPLRRTWLAAERGVARATVPKETARDDQRTEAVVKESWLFRTADRVLDDVTRAWQFSVVAGGGRRLVDRLTSRTAAERLRTAGAVALVASLTALGAGLLSRQPLFWGVPGAVAVGALVVILGSRAFAAAWEQRR